MIEKKIEPALSAEEWASFPNWPHAVVDDETSEDLPLYYPSSHGIAAANLHGQPFGFTREMAQAIRLVVALAQEHPDRLTRIGLRGAQDVTALWAAECIEALLPPEPTKADPFEVKVIWPTPRVLP